MYGENIINSNCTYGEIGVTNPSNIPSARYYATSSFDEVSNTLWLFGGRVDDSGKKKINNTYNYIHFFIR
jgi:hypothetical protein